MHESVGCVSWEQEKLLALPQHFCSQLLFPFIQKLDQKGRNISRIQLQLLPPRADGSVPSQPLIIVVIHIHFRDRLQCLERYPSTARANQSCCGNLAAAQRTDNNRMSFILRSRVGGLAEAVRGQNQLPGNGCLVVHTKLVVTSAKGTAEKRSRGTQALISTATGWLHAGHSRVWITR